MEQDCTGLCSVNTQTNVTIPVTRTLFRDVIRQELKNIAQEQNIVDKILNRTSLFSIYLRFQLS